jgi:hypothetical protein
MSYPKLSKAPVAAEYIKLEGKKALLNGKVVEVFTAETSNQVGSYERGIAWNRSKYGILCKGRTTNMIWASADHGVTWHRVDVWEKERALRYTRKGRVKLSHNFDKELAFEGIQKINRDYFGPGYRWKP